MSSKTAFGFELIPGEQDLEQLQGEMLHPLARLIAETIRRALDQGKLTIIGNQVRFCDKIDVPHGETETE